MKKLKFFFFGLLILFGAIFAGCGGGGGGPKGPGPDGPADAATQFILPGTYGNGQIINSDLTVKVYAIDPTVLMNACEDDNIPIKADLLFHGKTQSGGTKFAKQITDLNNQSRYIFAVIILDAETYSDFDLGTQTYGSLKKITEDDKIAAGFVVDSATHSPKPVILSRYGGTTVEGFELSNINEAATNSQIAINDQIVTFTFPSEYIKDKNNPPSVGSIIPGEIKSIKIYAVSETNNKNFSENGAFFNADWIYSTTSISGFNVKCPLPSDLKGKQRYVYALIILNDDYANFDLQRKTSKDLKNVTSAGKVLFGKIVNFDGEDGPVPLTSNNSGFKFYDMQLFSLTNFIVPDTYRTSKEGEPIQTKSIPGGSNVHFYILTPVAYANFAERGGVFVAEWTGSWKTNGSGGVTDIPFSDVPGVVDGEERHVLAVVSLDSLDPKYNDFNLINKTAKDCLVPFGKVALGYAKYQSGEEAKDGLIKIFKGGKIEFVFEDMGLKFPHFILPDSFDIISSDGSSTGTTAPMPSNKIVKIYFSKDKSAPYQGKLVQQGTTDMLDIPLPIGEDQGYISAIVILKGDYDLVGKKQDELLKAITEDGTILYGHVNDGNEISINRGDSLYARFAGKAP